MQSEYSSEEPASADLPQVLYKICVVGAGMVGSSAAKYAAKILSEEKAEESCSELRVLLIGPDEPKSRSEREIQAAHYDEARICRRTAGDLRWATVTSRAIKRFRDIEAESGIKFYEEVGCLVAGNPKEADYITHVHETVRKQQINSAKHLNSQELAELFPYLKLSEDHVGVWEPNDAGYINPRKLVQAQKILAEKYGCEVVKEIVRSIRPALDKELNRNGTKTTIMKIETDAGDTFYAEKVLLATNAFTDGFRELLPTGVSLNMSPVTQAVIFVELSADDLNKLQNMPSMLIQMRGPGNRECHSAETYDCYILPPVPYPDGKIYMKLGHGEGYEKSLTPAELVSWYRQPVPENIVKAMTDILETLFPDITPVSIHTDTCVTVNTATDLPYISSVGQSPDSKEDSSIAVAVGDCGCSAKCCDELGRLAAQLLISEWDDDILKENDFRVRLQHTKVVDCRL